MSDNTIDANKLRLALDATQPLWLFGYGSLIFKADFPYISKQRASIKNWERRFWQGSHGHRGTEHAPGRVVTLIQEAGSVCHGMAYKIEHSCLDHLDFREKNGYLRFMADLIFEDQTSAKGLVYIATEQNKAYLGPAAEKEIALQIARSHGPSGSNIDYFNQLYDALKEMSVFDKHMDEIEQALIENN